VSLRVLLVLLCACALAACGGGEPETQVSRSATFLPVRATTGVPRFGDSDPHEWAGVVPWKYQVHGIDVSKYQGDIDWRRVRDSGVSFAFVKATEGGDHSDERFLQNWAAARAAGVPRGAYHYYYFCRTAEEQAAWFMNHVPKDPSALPPVLDLEWTHKSRTCRLRPDAGTVRNEARTFLQLLQAYYRKRPVIYTTVDFYRDNELWRLEGYPFWLRSVAGHPSEVYPGQRWTFWQYTGTGVVDGIDGPTDLNVFAGSFGQMLGWAYGG
jgi:lysozyme